MDLEMNSFDVEELLETFTPSSNGQLDGDLLRVEYQPFTHPEDGYLEYCGVLVETKRTFHGEFVFTLAIEEGAEKKYRTFNPSKGRLRKIEKVS